MKKFALLVLLTLTTVSIYAAKDSVRWSKLPEKALINYGTAVVDKVIFAENDYVFRCNIKDWPDIIALDMPVKIRGVAPPDIVVKEGTPNTFFQTQAKKLIEKQLGVGENIELRNIARGKTFCLIADVYIDDKSLAEILIEEGVARKLKPGEKYPVEKAKKLNEEKKVVELQKDLPSSVQIETFTYLASKSSKIFHKSTCRSAKVISDSNRVPFGTRQQAADTGRKPCKICNP